MKELNPYSEGTEWLYEEGVGSPTEDRCLLVAILRQDGSEVAKGLDGRTMGDTLNAVCHRIVAVGPDVIRRKPGEIVIHLSAAADVADFLNPDARYLFVREKHIAYVWDHEKALAAFRKRKERLEQAEREARASIEAERVALRVK